MALGWLILGALIGIAAAQRKGFSVVGGLLGGLLLGPFAVLLFLVNGVFISNDGRTRTCPFCAESVKPEAVVCKHCGREFAERREPMSHRSGPIGL